MTTTTTWALLFRLARRNVLRNRRRSAVILVAIGVGLWAMLVFASFTRGWIDDVSRHAVATLTGHLQIHAPGYLQDPSVDHAMAPPSEELRRVLDGETVEAWASRVRVPAVVMSERETAGVTLVGIDPTREEGLSFIADAVHQGRNLEGAGDTGILLGRKLAEHLGTGIGKRVVVMSQAADHSVVDRGFVVVGIYTGDRSSTELGFVFVGRDEAQKMLGLGDRVSEISATLRSPIGSDPASVEAFVERLRSVAGDLADLDIEPWTTLEPMAQALVSLGEAWIWMFYVVMYIAMAFGLVNTMLMAVLERTREFGLLQALGMRPRLIVRQVLAESSILLAVGVLAGALLAEATLALLANGIDLSALAAGTEMWGMSKVIYPMLGMGDVISAVIFIVILGTLASLYPALRAARKVPVEAITRG